VTSTRAPGDDDLALLFQSRIETVGTEVGFSHYLFPKRESMATLLERLRTSEGIEYDKLDGFDRMAERGAEEVAKTATTLTGIDTSVEIRRLNFVSLESIPEQVANEKLVGVAFEFDGMPSGYLLFLFDEESAHEIVDAMVPMEVDEDGFGEMGTSAIKELGNIMASGFLDGWANVLDTTIDHSPPEFIHDIGAAAVDPVIIQLGENQDFAFVFDTVVMADGREFDCEVYAIPDESDLERALNNLDVDRSDRGGPDDGGVSGSRYHMKTYGTDRAHRRRSVQSASRNWSSVTATTRSNPTGWVRAWPSRCTIPDRESVGWHTSCCPTATPRITATRKPGKYADTAIRALLRRMVEQGANYTTVEAKIAGGSDMFEFEFSERASASETSPPRRANSRSSASRSRRKTSVGNTVGPSNSRRERECSPSRPRTATTE